MFPSMATPLLSERPANNNVPQLYCADQKKHLQVSQNFKGHSDATIVTQTEATQGSTPLLLRALGT